MTEVQAILASGGGIIFIYILGWAGNAWHKNRLNGRNSGIYSERQDNMEKRLDSLPCQDSKYMIEWGKVIQGQEDTQLRVTKLEQTVKDSQKDIQNRMGNLEEAIRLRKRLESR